MLRESENQESQHGTVLGHQAGAAGASSWAGRCAWRQLAVAFLCWIGSLPSCCCLPMPGHTVVECAHHLHQFGARDPTKPIKAAGTGARATAT